MIEKDNIEVINLIPKFINFYEKAKNEDMDTIWGLWKENYNFAAVPPDENGQMIAKKLLFQSWNKYYDKISFIKEWKPNFKKIEYYLNKIKKLLGYEKRIDFALIYYVGTFENNSFIAPYSNNKNALCLSVENGENDILLVHELAHIVHLEISKLSSNWSKLLSTLILQEGLAMQVSKNIIPNKDDRFYTEATKGWLDICQKQSKYIYEGIIKYIEDNSSETIYKFTMEKGTTGIEREAYFVGWNLVSELLNEGNSFKDIANYKEFEINNIVNTFLTNKIKFYLKK